MFELYQLRYFLAVVETGNFTKAAERACVTQPTLSAGIKKLELALGKQLFERSNRRVFLTDAGAGLVERAKSILYECNQAAMAAQEEQETSVLRLGVLRTIPSRLTAKLIKAFREAYPDIAIELMDGTEQELANRLDQQGIDAAISILRPGWQASDAVPLLEEGYALALHADHPLADRDVAHAVDLANNPMVVRTRCEVLSDTSRYFTDHNVRPRLVYRTQHDERALAMVSAGLGATVIPQCYEWEGMAKLHLQGFDYRRSIALLPSPHGVAMSNQSGIAEFREFVAGVGRALVKQAA